MISSIHVVVAITVAGYVMCKLMDWFTDGGDPPYGAFFITGFMLLVSLVTR